jgi:hypothetical protein
VDTAANIIPMSETDLKPDEDTIPLMRAGLVFSTRNVEP